MERVVLPWKRSVICPLTLTSKLAEFLKAKKAKMVKKTMISQLFWGYYTIYLLSLHITTLLIVKNVTPQEDSEPVFFNTSALAVLTKNKG